MKDFESSHSFTILTKENAIRNMGGMTWLYEKHVAKFVREYADSADRIQQLLDDDQWEAARQLAHSIKGLCGTLGFNDLFVSVAQLEAAIHFTSDTTQNLLDIYKIYLKRTIESCSND